MANMENHLNYIVETKKRQNQYHVIYRILTAASLLPFSHWCQFCWAVCFEHAPIFGPYSVPLVALDWLWPSVIDRWNHSCAMTWTMMRATQTMMMFRMLLVSWINSPSNNVAYSMLFNRRKKNNSFIYEQKIIFQTIHCFCSLSYSKRKLTVCSQLTEAQGFRLVLISIRSILCYYHSAWKRKISLRLNHLIGYGFDFGFGLWQ